MTVARVDRLIINKREWRERKKSAYAECKKKKKKKKGKKKWERNEESKLEEDYKEEG